MLLNPLHLADGAKRIVLRDPNVTGNPVLAIMDFEKVEEFSDADMKMLTEKVFRTLEPEHPGVASRRHNRDLRPDPGTELLLLRGGLP